MSSGPVSSSRGDHRWRLPERAGSIPCRIVLAADAAGTLIDALHQRYPFIATSDWTARFAAGDVVDDSGRALAPDALAHPRQVVHYYRPLAEPVLAADETVLAEEPHLLVVDKPHFMPTTPAGRWYEQSLVRRLRRRYGEPELTPLHRLDRLTAGLVLVARSADARTAYQALFRERRIRKRYEAFAAALPALRFPHVRESRIERHPDGFRVHEVPGEPNARTRIEVLERDGPVWRYALEPETGRMHQLRVHLAALGAPIVGDPWYPEPRPATDDDPSSPMRLLAAALAYDDPLDGRPRHWHSALSLSALRQDAGG
jgi:tRNA pseudouridine32 synthase/23S rRNA pseudouridine746 synthase